MSYTIQLHQHRFAAWAASRAAATSKLCRFEVVSGIAILETCGFTAELFHPDQLPEPAQVDKIHRGWRQKVVEAAEKLPQPFTHGVAAKLINCYLKSRFVCAGAEAHPNVQALHPPVDSVLLKELWERNYAGQGTLWRRFEKQRWSKYDSDTYEQVIKLMRDSLPSGEPMWKIEQFWKGHQ